MRSYADTVRICRIRPTLRSAIFILACLFASAAVAPSTAIAAGKPCRAIRTEKQLEHVNGLVDEGKIQELPDWVFKPIHPKVAAKHGAATKLRATYAKAGKSHIALDYNCPAILEVTVAKRLETCEPNPVKEEITCGKRWFVTSSKERWIRLRQTISLSIKAGPNREVSVRFNLPPWFIPGHYALNGAMWTKELTFGG